MTLSFDLFIFILIDLDVFKKCPKYKKVSRFDVTCKQISDIYQSGDKINLNISCYENCTQNFC